MVTVYVREQVKYMSTFVTVDQVMCFLSAYTIKHEKKKTRTRNIFEAE